MKKSGRRWIVPWLAVIFGIAVAVFWSWHSWRQVDFFTVGRGPQVAVYSDCSSVSFYFLKTPTTIGLSGGETFGSTPGYRSATVTELMWEGQSWFGRFIVNGRLGGLVPNVVFVSIPIWLLMAPTIVPLGLMLWERRRAAAAEA